MDEIVFIGPGNGFIVDPFDAIYYQTSASRLCPYGQLGFFRVDYLEQDSGILWLAGEASWGISLDRGYWKPPRNSRADILQDVDKSIGPTPG
jgi:hypothetical protein